LRQWTEVLNGEEVRKGRIEAGRDSDAPAQARYAQEWLRRNGQEPEAGHRDWFERGAREGRQSPFTPQRIKAFAQGRSKAQLIETQLIKAQLIEAQLIEPIERVEPIALTA
jgi:hypothetical protein